MNFAYNLATYAIFSLISGSLATQNSDSTEGLLTDVFTIDQRQHGAIILHIFGVFYMFIASIIVCSEYFVPSIFVIREKFHISGHIAGTTIIVLCISVPSTLRMVAIGLTDINNIHIGNTVGPSVFNTTFIIMFCAFFSKRTLKLSMWPLLRDTFVYSVALILLTTFFLDNKVVWYETLLMFDWYIHYYCFLPNDSQVQRIFKKLFKVREDGSDDVIDNNSTDYDVIKPVSLTWPSTILKRIIYVFIFPIILPLWITLPNVRRTRSKFNYIVTYIGSVFWICVITYLMVWWCSVIAVTLRVQNEILGLTVLGMGTSIPVLVASIMIARTGDGNMALSFAMGLNIFAICCGIPGSWILWALSQYLKNLPHEPIEESSDGVVCSVSLMFLVLIIVWISIIASKWQMKKGLGIVMLTPYILFVLISIAFTNRYIVCPV